MPSAYPARLVNVDLTNFQRNVPTYPVIYNEFDDASAMMGDTYRLSIYTMDTQFVDNKKRKKEEEKEEIRGRKTEEKRRGAGEEEGRKNMKGWKDESKREPRKFNFAACIGLEHRITLAFKLRRCIRH